MECGYERDDANGDKVKMWASFKDLKLVYGPKQKELSTLADGIETTTQTFASSVATVTVFPWELQDTY